jgi:hypothetical protein
MDDERSTGAGRDDTDVSGSADPAMMSGSSQSLGGIRAEGASVVQLELGIGRNAAVILWLSSFLAALALFLAIGAGYWASLAEREARILNDNVLRLQIRLEETGLISREESH